MFKPIRWSIHATVHCVVHWPCQNQIKLTVKCKKKQKTKKQQKQQTNNTQQNQKRIFCVSVVITGYKSYPDSIPKVQQN